MPNTHLVPELGVEIPADLSPMELMTRAEAACNTVAYLQACGLEDEDPTPYDAELSAMITAAYAIDPNQTSKDMTDQAFSSLSIPTVRLVGSILDEFGVSAARSAIALRNLVENKLVIETENPDARIR